MSPKWICLSIEVQLCCSSRSKDTSYSNFFSVFVRLGSLISNTHRGKVKKSSSSALRNTLHQPLWIHPDTEHNLLKTNPHSHLSVSSLWCGFFARQQSWFTSRADRVLLLRSSSLRWEGLDVSAEARNAQLIPDTMQLSSLNISSLQKKVSRKPHSCFTPASFS